MTKKEIKQAVDTLEAVTGMTCTHFRGLPKNATIKQIRVAWSRDRMFLRVCAYGILYLTKTK